MTSAIPEINSLSQNHFFCRTRTLKNKFRAGCERFSRKGGRGSSKSPHFVANGGKTLEIGASRLEANYDYSTPKHPGKFLDPPQCALSAGLARVSSYPGRSRSCSVEFCADGQSYRC